MKNRKINEDWETRKRPKAPKSIRAKGIRGFLGVISPSKAQMQACAGNEEVQEYFTEVRKYLNFRRMTTKQEWYTFYRYLRWKNKVKGSGEIVR